MVRGSGGGWYYVLPVAWAPQSGREEDPLEDREDDLFMLIDVPLKFF